MFGLDPVLFWFVATALFANFLNGFNGSANSVATMIASRAMRPSRALLLSAVAHFLGPLLSGVAVATAIGSTVLQRNASQLPVVWAALLATLVWSILASLVGVPSSYSHALMGGLTGAALAGYGLAGIKPAGMLRVLVILFTSPLLGIVAGYLLMRLVLFLCRAATPRVNNFFRRAQIVTATALAFSHGSNDAQKTMGLVTMGLLAREVIPTFAVPVWVVMACAASIALGTALGGWRVITTLGRRFYKIRPIHSFTSQLASSAIIFGAGLLGGPVSTSQIVSTTILSVGAAERMNKVRWGVMRQISAAWFVTIPAVAALAALFYLFLEKMV